MTEKQTQEQPNIEDILTSMASLKGLSRGLDDSKKPSERLPLYLNLTDIISKNSGVDPKTIYEDIRVSPEEAIRYAEENKHSLAESSKELYNQNKENITNYVLNSMKKDVSEAEDASDAALKIYDYLALFLPEAPELTQPIADRYAQRNVEKQIGVSMNFSAKGNINVYRDWHEEMFYKKLVSSEYLKFEEDNEGNVKYNLDEEKIKDIMNDIERASVLFAVAKQKENRTPD